MKPLPDDFFAADKAKTELQIKREQEITDFINSGAMIAELEQFGNTTITTQLEGYKRAVRMVIYRERIKDFRIQIRQKNRMVVAVRIPNEGN